MKKITVFIIFLLFPFLMGETYYFDSVSGNDGNLGTSEEQAWQTYEKFNSTTFSAGDSILFKKGTTFAVGGWNDYMVIDDSGTSENPITITSYGTGDRPKLDGMNPTAITGFTEYATNVWVKTGAQQCNRFWLDDEEKLPSNSRDNLSALLPWYETGSTLYVYAESDPNSKWTTYKAQNGLKILDSNYIIIDGLQIGGVRYYALSIRNSSHNIVRNCRIYNHGNSGVQLSYQTAGQNQIQAYNEIYNNVFDSEYKLAYVSNQGTANTGGISGVLVGGGSQYNQIHNNTIYRSLHGGLDISASSSELPITQNNFYKNTIDGKNGFYSRGVGIGGGEGKCLYNYITQNVVKNCTIRSQINGEHNFIRYNVWMAGGLSNIHSDRSQHVQFQEWTGTISKNNVFENNVVTGAYDVGLYSYSATIRNNIVRNNIFYNNGTGVNNNAQIRIGSDAPDDGQVVYNNIFFSDSTSNVVLYDETAYDLATAESTFSDFYNNIGTDPAFINLSGNNFCLNSDSDAIDSGFDNGNMLDFYGNISGYAGGVDIGVCELGKFIKYYGTTVY